MSIRELTLLIVILGGSIISYFTHKTLMAKLNSSPPPTQMKVATIST